MSGITGMCMPDWIKRYRQMKIDVFSLVIIAIVGSGALYALYSIMKVKRNGIEVDACVTRIVEDVRTDADGIYTDYTCYVRYRTLEGRTIEATLANPKSRLYVGSNVRIKYLPENEDYPVLVQVLD